MFFEVAETSYMSDVSHIWLSYIEIKLLLKVYRATNFFVLIDIVDAKPAFAKMLVTVD